MDLTKVQLLKLLLSSSALSGVIVAVLNYFFSNVLKNREARLKIIDKFTDKKINAYDKVMDFVMTTRMMNIFDNDKIESFDVNFTKYDYPLRYPAILDSNKSFGEYESNFTNLNSIYGRWLNTEIIRELNFLQDYIIVLDRLVKNLSDYELREIGVAVRQDFVDISSNLEKLCFNFYSEGILKLKIEDKNKWHKYKRQETEKRFNNTMLARYMENIKRKN